MYNNTVFQVRSAEIHIEQRVIHCFYEAGLIAAFNNASRQKNPPDFVLSTSKGGSKEQF